MRVITHTHADFEKFVAGKDRDAYTYIAHADDLRGAQVGSQVLTVGNWAAREDYMELRRAISMRRLVVVVCK